VVLVRMGRFTYGAPTPFAFTVLFDHVVKAGQKWLSTPEMKKVMVGVRAAQNLIFEEQNLSLG